MIIALQRYRACLHEVECSAGPPADGEETPAADAARLAIQVRTLYEDIRSAWASLDVDDAGSREMAAAFHDEGQLFSMLAAYLHIIARTESKADQRARWKEIASMMPGCFRGVNNIELIARRQIGARRHE